MCLHFIIEWLNGCHCMDRYLRIFCVKGFIDILQGYING